VFNTQVIPQLIDWNFGTDKYPKLTFTPFSDTIRTAIMDTFKTILAARFPQVSAEMVLELEKKVAEELGLEIDYVAVQARIEKERAALQNIETKATPNSKKGGPGTTKGANEEESDGDLASQ